MSLNLPYFSVSNINTIIWTTTIYLFYNYTNSNLNWYDLFARVLANEFHLNIYYFMWTSFWYIPFLILVIIIWQLNKFFWHRLQTIHYVLVAILYLIIIDLQSYWITNTYPYDLVLKSEHFNNLLVNSINKYHPGLLYISSIMIITHQLGLNGLLVGVTYKFNTHFGHAKWRKPFIHLSLILCTTLGFGSWWALQEGSWGGWWNWDPSEVFGLIILLFYLTYLHFNFSKQNFFYHVIHNKLFFIILLQIYFFTQLNFDLVSHNFGTKIDNFIDNTNLYTCIILGSFVYLRYLYSVFKYIYIWRVHDIYRASSQNTSYFWLYGYVLVVLLLYELLYSLIPLVNDFLWKVSGLNISNYIISFEKLNLQLYIIVVLAFWNWYVYILLLVFMTSSSIINLLIILTKVPYRSALIFHFLIGTFIIVSLYSTSYTNVAWSQPVIWISDLTTVGAQFNNLTTISINNFSLDYNLTYYTSGHFILSWNTIWLDTTLEVYSFVYTLVKDITSQMMLIGSNLFLFTIRINDILSFNLVILFTIISLTYVYLFYRNLKIIF